VSRGDRDLVDDSERDVRRRFGSGYEMSSSILLGVSVPSNRVTASSMYGLSFDKLHAQ
jgi:hypothetical protein